MWGSNGCCSSMCVFVGVCVGVTVIVCVIAWARECMCGAPLMKCVHACVFVGCDYVGMCEGVVVTGWVEQP